MVMTMQEKIAFLEEIMELDEGELSPDLQLDDIEEWDSLTQLTLMASIKRLNDKTITVDELRGFQTVEDICNYLE